MKILLAHNYYGSSVPSGENLVFELERDLLKSRGHEVRTLTRSSDQIRANGLLGLLKGGFSTPWNRDSYREMQRTVSDFSPDIVHVHNFFPLISPSIFHAVGTHAASVLTLHNYRLLCPAAIPMRAGRVCTECIDQRSAIPSIVHGCYRGSRMATAPLAAMVSLHRRMGTWKKKVDAFIALSAFQKDLMGAAGLPDRKIFVKPNFYPGSPLAIPWHERREAVVFVGRVGEEKGVDDLIQAWRLLGAAAPDLVVVGDGPMRAQLQHQVKMDELNNISFTGHVESARAQRLIATSKLVILPSKWFEGFPMVLREAFAFGTPSIVSNIGPLPSLVGNGAAGLIVEVGNAAQLAESVINLWNDQTKLEEMSQVARRYFQTSYTEDVNYKLLTEVYEQAMRLNRVRKTVAH